MIDDARRCGQDNMTELTTRQKVNNLLFNVQDLDVKAGRNNATLVNASKQANNNLAAAVVVDNLKFADISVPLHNLEELNDHATAWSDQYLPLSSLLCVVNSLERICENTHAHHLALTIDIERG